MEDHQRSAFFESVRSTMRGGQENYRTERVSVDWLKRFVLFNGERHCQETREVEVGA